MKFGTLENGHYRKASARAVVVPVSPRRARCNEMAALVALVLILAILGGLGFAVHVLWYALMITVLLWLIGFFIGGVEVGDRDGGMGAGSPTS